MRQPHRFDTARHLHISKEVTLDYERLRDHLEQSNMAPNGDRSTDERPASGAQSGRGRSRQEKRALRKASRATAPPPSRPVSRTEQRIQRHVIRQLALLALFELDVTGHPFEAVVRRVIDDPYLAMVSPDQGGRTEFELDLPPEALADQEELENGVRALVFGVIDNVAGLDATIVRVAPAFPIERIGVIDRNALRLGAFELREGVPGNVPAIINDAVELAKRFGGETSAGFVNGVLRTISEEQRPASVADEPSA